MAIKNKNGEYLCSYCSKIFVHPQDADACRDNHNLIYVALTKEDLSRIMQFIVTKDDDLLGERLIKRLQAYARTKINP